MVDCTNHENRIVVYTGEACPLCTAEEILNNLMAEIEKSMEIWKELKQSTASAKKIGKTVHSFN